MKTIKTRGITVRRIDTTVPMTTEEEKQAKKLKKSVFRFPKTFIVRVNNSIPFNHKMCK